MKITVAFDVKNRVEILEGWPINQEDVTFFLEREDNLLKRVCVTFSDVGLEHAPRITSPADRETLPYLRLSAGSYIDAARRRILNWQAVVCGLKIVDIDYDGCEVRFKAQSAEEEPYIQIHSFKRSTDFTLNATCEFEQLGRAFCVEPLPDDRIESTSHFREGRIAFEAGRYVDSYNNMFLFLETRYCDGKTKTVQQVEQLLKQHSFCEIVERTSVDMKIFNGSATARDFDVFAPSDDLEKKVKALVLLRGKLRHHSLKSPSRWDPNRQTPYEPAARFLGAVVAEIVIAESLADLYQPTTLDEFRRLSVDAGFETKINVSTTRLRREPSLCLEMSYPTTVVTSQLCLAALRSSIEACERDAQLADTTRLEAVHTRTGLELFSVEFDIWANTQTRAIEARNSIGTIRCSFECMHEANVVKHEFLLPVLGNKITIPDVWNLLAVSLDHIEKRDPTTRVMSLKLLLKGEAKAIAAYRVGAQVRG